jgi:hypothetical protein
MAELEQTHLALAKLQLVVVVEHLVVSAPLQDQKMVVQVVVVMDTSLGLVELELLDKVLLAVPGKMEARTIQVVAAAAALLLGDLL